MIVMPIAVDSTMNRSHGASLPVSHSCHAPWRHQDV